MASIVTMDALAVEFDQGGSCVYLLSFLFVLHALALAQLNARFSCLVNVELKSA